MKKAFFTSILLLSAGLLASCSNRQVIDKEAPMVPTPPVYMEATTPGWEDLETLVLDGIDQEVYPGAVLIVGQPGKTIWAKAYGKFTYDEGAQPMELDSIFDLASVSKVVGTASGAWLMLEEEKLHTDDLVSTYIDGFGVGGKKEVTIANLMTHTSGLKAYENKDKVERNRKDGESHADALIRNYAALPAVYTPAEGYTYSCLNFQTTARVVENVSGRRLEDLLKERVFGPLGMGDTVYTLSEEQKTRTVPTLLNEDGSKLVAQVHDPLANYHGVDSHCPGNAGLFSSAVDIARYCEMILNDGEYYGTRVYKPETIAMATMDQSPEKVNNMRGLGWGIYEDEPYITPINLEAPENYVIGHTGYTGTFIWLDKYSDTYMVFFTNRVYPDDKSQPDGHLNIGTVRRNLAEAILLHLPEYEDYFKSKNAEEGEKVASE